MRITLTTTVLVLVLGWPLAAAATAADDLPAQAQRIWAPTGDEIGLHNHATAELLINDDHGDEAQAAADWSLLGKSFGSGLFNYQRRSEQSHLLALRGFGGNLESSGLAGDFGLWSSAPGIYGARITYSAHDLYYDRDSEMRSPAFPFPPPPPALAFTPHLGWQRGVFDLRYQLADGLQVRGGVTDLRRDGRKSSLLRGAVGDAPPQVQTVDSRIYEIWVGGSYSNGPLASELRLSYEGSDDVRTYTGRHEYDHDRKLYQARLAAAYDLNPTTRVLLHGGLSRLELLGNEAWATSRNAAIDGDTDTQVGQLALLARLAPRTTVRATARFSAQQSDIRVDEGPGILYAADRSRDRQDYRLVVDNADLPDTRVRLQYRLTKTSQEEITAQDGRPGNWNAGDTQTLDQDVTRHDVGLQSRTRLSRQARLKLGLQWTSVDVDQDRTWDTQSGDPWYGVLGDHKRARLAWDVALQMRPRRNLPVDFGYQGRDQTFERTGAGKVETTWHANRLFASVNWLAERRLTVYGMVSYGKESYELVGVQQPAAGMGAFNHDGTTLRFMPGAVLQLSRCLQLEGMYEGIRFENTGDESANLNPVKADHDRTLLRLRWQATETLAAAFTYRRNEFDENRWDDYIQDLYAVSLSGRF
jgi:hypothetical protein